MAKINNYALIKNGFVESIFSSDKLPADFPDIKPFLVAVDDTVSCGDLYDGVSFSKPAPPQKTHSTFEFFNLFTKDERLAIHKMAAVNDDIADWYMLALSANEIDLAHPLVQKAMDGLVGAGILTPDREVEILS